MLLTFVLSIVQWTIKAMYILHYVKQYMVSFTPSV